MSSTGSTMEERMRNIAQARSTSSSRRADQQKKKPRQKSFSSSKISMLFNPDELTAEPSSPRANDRTSADDISVELQALSSPRDVPASASKTPRGSKKSDKTPRFKEPRQMWQTAFGLVQQKAPELAKYLKGETFELRAMFRQIDRSSTGEVQADDIGNIFHSIGIELSAEDLRDLFDELDEDVSGSISFKEFSDTCGPIREALSRFKITEQVNMLCLTGIFTDHREYEDLLTHDKGVYMIQKPQLATDTSTLAKGVAADDISTIDLHTLPAVTKKLGHDLTADEHGAAISFIMEHLSEEEKQKRITFEDDVGAVVDVQAVAELLLNKLALKDGQQAQNSGAGRGQQKRVANLLPEGYLKHNGKAVAADFGLEVWRMLFRRFFILDECHKKCKDMMMLFGQRRMDTEMQRIDDIDQARAERRCFFFPESEFRFRWDLMQMVLLISTAFFTPLRAGFDVSIELFSSWFWMELLSDVYFWIDIGVSFRSAYYDRRGALVINQATIARSYIVSWFLIDVASCLPVQYVEYAVQASAGNAGTTGNSANRSIKIIKVLRLFRLAKMLRLLRLKRLLARYEEYLTDIMQSVMILKMLLGLLFVMHLMACGWFAVGMMYEDNEFHQATDDKYEGASNTMSSVKEGWALSFRFTDKAALVSKYLKSLFYCITDFAVEVASTDYEMLYVCFQHVIYEGFFAFITGAFASSIITGRISESRRAEKMGEIREFLLKNKIPIDLRQSVTAYYEHYFSKKSVFDESKLLKDFPPRLRNDVINVMYGQKMKNMPFFRGLSDEVSFRLCMALKPVMVPKHELVFVQGTPGHELYMIHFGQCKVFTKQSQHDTFSDQKTDGTELQSQAKGCCCGRRRGDPVDEETSLDLANHKDFGASLGTLSTGSFFGELAVIEQHYVHDRTIIAAVDTELGYIEKEEIDKLAEEKPELFFNLNEFSRKRRKHEKRRKLAILEQISKANSEISANVRTAPYTVWVGHLGDRSLSESLIRRTLSKFGTVESVFVRQMPKSQGENRSWAFVVYQTRPAAKNAIRCAALTHGILVGTDEHVQIVQADPELLKDTPVVKIRRDDLTLLDKIKRFSHRLTAEGIKALKATATRRDFSAGSQICKEGDTGSTMFVIMTGTADQYERASSATKTITRGSCFGENVLFGSANGKRNSGCTFLATVVATSNMSCLCIERECFQETASKYGVTNSRDHAQISHASSNHDDDDSSDDERIGRRTSPDISSIADIPRRSIPNGRNALRRNSHVSSDLVAAGRDAVVLGELAALRKLVEMQATQIGVLIKQSRT